MEHKKHYENMKIFTLLAIIAWSLLMLLSKRYSGETIDPNNIISKIERSKSPEISSHWTSGKDDVDFYLNGFNRAFVFNKERQCPDEYLVCPVIVTKSELSRSNLTGDVNKRLATFHNFPSECPITSECLAAAGFCYNGTDDVVYCPVCNVHQGNWQLSDIPHDVHQSSSPDCPMVIRNASTSTGLLPVLTETVPNAELDSGYAEDLQLEDYNFSTLGSSSVERADTSDEDQQTAEGDSFEEFLDYDTDPLAQIFGLSLRDSTLVEEPETDYTDQDIH